MAGNVNFGSYTGSILVAPGDGFGNSAGSPASQAVFLIPGFGAPDERSAEVQAFSTSLDAVNWAYTNGFGAFVFQGVHAQPASDHVITSPVTGGIFNVIAAMDLTSSNTCSFQLWYVKNLTSGGFTAGQAFEITAGVGGMSSPFSNTGSANYTFSSQNGARLNSGRITLGGGVNASGDIGYFTTTGAGTPTGTYVVASTAISGNILTINTSGTHNLLPGQLVSFSGFTNHTELNPQYLVVLTRPSNTSFTVWFSHANYSTAVEGGSARAIFVGWYPDYADLIIATITVPSGGNVNNFQFITQWLD